MMTMRRPAAIVGADSLQGRELGLVLRQRRLPVTPRLFSSLKTAPAADESAETRRLMEFDEEAQWIETPGAAELAEMGLVFFADDAATARALYPALPAGCAAIDLTGGLADIPGAELTSAERLEARSLERNLGPGPWLTPNAAALTLARALERLSESARIERAAAVVIRPVSQRGQAGIRELHEQARALLGFQPVPTQVLGGQLAFNLRPEGMNHPDEPGEARQLAEQIERLLAEAERPVIVPALRILDAPIFHAYLITLWFETAGTVDAQGLSRWMKSAAADPDALAIADAEAPAPGPVRKDEQGGYWLHLTADDLKIPSVEAVRIAELLLLQAKG